MSSIEQAPRNTRLKAFTARFGARTAVAGALAVGLTAAVAVAPSAADARSRTPRGGSSSATRTPTKAPTPTPTKTPAATPASAAPVTSSGQAMPVGNVGNWTQIFTDDFTTNVATGSFPAAVSGKWGAYSDGWKDTSKFGTYMPSKVISVHDGVMDLNVRTENGDPMVSAPVPKVNGATGAEGQLYGRYSVRFKSDSMPGYKMAWLLWPDTYNWNDGEIDFPEAGLDGAMTGFMHYRNNPASQDWYKSAATVNSWHTATIEWSPASVRFLLDDAVVGTSTDTTKIPNTPMHWVLQTETDITDRAPAANVAGHLLIDWVSVYRYAG
jgi:beta-glucanase (GH16 family)